MKAKLIRTTNPIFPYKFKCPIDKRWSLVGKDSKDQNFGVCQKTMGIIANVIPAIVDFEKMEVCAVK